MLTKISIKKKRILARVFVLIISCMIFLCYGSKKRISYADEVYTYTITNAESAFVQFVAGQWTTGEEISKAFMHDSSDNFDHMINMVKFDKVHPPLYYILLYMFFSIFEGSMSIWIPLLLNLIFYLATISLIFSFTYRIFGNLKLSVVITLLCAFNIGMISTAMFIRMYMMLTFFLMAFVYVSYLIWENRDKYFLYIILTFITVCGFLTQYYFALFAIGCYITEFLYDIWSKKVKSLLLYSAAMAASVVISTIVWKIWLKCIFTNVHSQSMIEKTKGIENTLFKNIPRTIEYLYGTVFRGKYMIVFVLLIVCVLCVTLSKKIRQRYGINSILTIVKVFIAANFNAFVITEMAPDYLLSNRYYYAPASQILLIAVISIFMIAGLVQYKKISGMVVAAVIVFLFGVYTLKSNSIDYYTNYKDYDRNIEQLEEYAHIPWIYSGSEGWITRNHLMEFVIPDNMILVDESSVPNTNDEILKKADEFLLLGYDDWESFTDIGIEYYTKCTGYEVEKEKVMVWNSLHVYLVKRAE